MNILMVLICAWVWFCQISFTSHRKKKKERERERETGGESGKQIINGLGAQVLVQVLLQIPRARKFSSNPELRTFFFLLETEQALTYYCPHLKHVPQYAVVFPESISSDCTMYVSSIITTGRRQQGEHFAHCSILDTCI